MQKNLRARFNSALTTWGPHLLLLAASVFFTRLGQGLIGGASTNFFVDELGLEGRQVLWLAGLREIPGLGLVFIAALMLRWPLQRRAAAAVLLMAVGYGLYALIHSYVALVAVAIVASLGFHVWMPLQSAIGLALVERERSGRVLGALASMGALASIVGMGVTALLATTVPLRWLYVVGGASIALAALFVSRIPAGGEEKDVTRPRVLFRWRYWIYYVLIFFEGSRMQVFGTFGTLVLVQDYGLGARQISLLLVLSGIVNFALAPRMGQLLDVIGERITLAASYVLLAFCFVGYATVHNAWFLGGMLIAINLLVTLRIGLSTYVNRIAPDHEVAPTLSAGVSVNHITSVSMSLVAGALLDLVGYEWLCWGAAAIIMLSVPFALAIKVDPRPASSPAKAGAPGT
jgi:predicted MFS family arabinose efflux permease